MDQSGKAARLGALGLLCGVLEDGRLLSEITGSLDRLAPDDRARAQRLATQTLRWLPNADKVLSPFLKKAPMGRVMHMLRMATVELCTGGAAHGVVNSAVDIVAGNRKTAGLKGLVNAVLRKVAAEGPAKWEGLPPPRMPKWLRSPLKEAWGEEGLVLMEAAHAETPPLDLTVKSDPESWAKRLGGTVLPTGSVRLESPGQVTALDGYAEGAWWVQDAAAAIPAQLLNVQPGQTALDLCAAPGGKTLQLAASGAKVTAIDRSESRMARVHENLSRTGLKANCQVADALKMRGTFDGVLLDAPCSATGTLRRHPDLPYAKDGSGFFDLMTLQARLLTHAATLVRQGGRLVFCTCSVLPDEGEVQVEQFLKRSSGWTLVPAELPGLDPAWHTEGGALRLLPRPGGTDGFYIAVLQKD